jgi:hypothetical protein
MHIDHFNNICNKKIAPRKKFAGGRGGKDGRGKKKGGRNLRPPRFLLQMEARG